MRGSFSPIFSLACAAAICGLALIPASALGGSASCYLHGIIVPTYGSQEKYTLSDMIRLHFDADDKSKCEQMMESYCVHNVKQKDYSSERLKGSFKADTDRAEESTYHFTAACKIAAD